MSYPYEADIEGLIRETLLTVWEGPAVDAYIQGFSSLIQEIEDLHLEVRTALDIEVATGLFLDILGGWIGEPRGDLDDETYRRFILAKKDALRSLGTVSEIRRLTDTITEGSSVVLPAYPARYRIEITVTQALGDLRVERLQRFLDIVSPAGVGRSAFEGNENFFRFDDNSRGLDKGELGRLL